MERRREISHLSIHSSNVLINQVCADSRSQELHPGLHEVAGPQVLVPSSAAFPAYQQGVGSQVEQLSCRAVLGCRQWHHQVACSSPRPPRDAWGHSRGHGQGTWPGDVARGHGRGRGQGTWQGMWPPVNPREAAVVTARNSAQPAPSTLQASENCLSLSHPWLCAHTHVLPGVKACCSIIRK